MVNLFNSLFISLSHIHTVTLRTPATWIRNYVRSHPSYKFDSVVSQEICYDMMVAIDEMYASLVISMFIHQLSRCAASGASAKPQK